MVVPCGHGGSRETFLPQKCLNKGGIYFIKNAKITAGICKNQPTEFYKRTMRLRKTHAEFLKPIETTDALILYLSGALYKI